MAFSAFSNIEKILNLNHSKGSFTAIHGIRAITISWVVLGHTYVAYMSAAGKFFSEFSFLVILTYSYIKIRKYSGI